jgi:hypothetical protein
MNDHLNVTILLALNKEREKATNNDTSDWIKRHSGRVLKWQTWFKWICKIGTQSGWKKTLKVQKRKRKTLVLKKGFFSFPKYKLTKKNQGSMWNHAKKNKKYSHLYNNSAFNLDKN